MCAERGQWGRPAAQSGACARTASPSVCGRKARGVTSSGRTASSSSDSRGLLCQSTLLRLLMGQGRARPSDLLAPKRGEALWRPCSLTGLWPAADGTRTGGGRGRGPFSRACAAAAGAVPCCKLPGSSCPAAEAGTPSAAWGLDCISAAFVVLTCSVAGFAVGASGLLRCGGLLGVAAADPASAASLAAAGCAGSAITGPVAGSGWPDTKELPHERQHLPGVFEAGHVPKGHPHSACGPSLHPPQLQRASEGHRRCRDE